jgi:hypothetical protein
MDCDNARLFLPYLTPSGRDLDGPEAAELRAHLDQCAACNALAMNTKRVDHHLGRAMRAVPVPAGMKERILARLAEERAVRRRWLRRAVQAAAVAAALLLLVWGGYTFWWVQEFQQVDADKIYTKVILGPPDYDEVNEAVAHLDVTRPPLGGRVAPDFCNYEYLVGEPALARLPGNKKQRVPQLVFVRPSADLSKKDKARKAIVYVIKKRQEDKVKGPFEANDPEYRYKIDVRVAKHDPTLAYVVLYDGDNYDWLLVKHNN